MCGRCVRLNRQVYNRASLLAFGLLSRANSASHVIEVVGAETLHKDAGDPHCLSQTHVCLMPKVYWSVNLPPCGATFTILCRGS